jgi:hypothetical protein
MKGAMTGVLRNRYRQWAGAVMRTAKSIVEEKNIVAIGGQSQHGVSCGSGEHPVER